MRVFPSHLWVMATHPPFLSYEMARILDLLRERTLFFTNDKMKLQLLDALPFWTATLISGTVAVIYASLISWEEEGTREFIDWNNSAMFAVSLICFLAAWWMVVKWAPNAAGSGIPQVVAAIEPTKGIHIEKINGLLGLRILLVKIASSVVMVFGGGAAGGIFTPSLASGANIGTVFADLLKLTATETNLLILFGMAGFLTSITRSPSPRRSSCWK